MSKRNETTGRGIGPLQGAAIVVASGLGVLLILSGLLDLGEWIGVVARGVTAQGPGLLNVLTLVAGIAILGRCLVAATNRNDLRSPLDEP